MAAYNRRPADGQPSSPPTHDEAETSRNAADRLLLASVAVADSAQAVAIERTLRQYALRLVAGGSRMAVEVARDGLDLLLERSRAESAWAAVVESDAATTLLCRRGSLEGRAEDLVSLLLAAANAASSRGRALEIPGEAGSTLPPDAGALLQSTSVRSLRWVVRPLGGGRTLLVALQSTTPRRYWTPACCRLHDGLADVLAAAAPQPSAQP